MLMTQKALNIKAKTKPALPEKDPGETGYQLNFGGGGGSRTRVRKHSALTSTYLSCDLVFAESGLPQAGCRVS
jgi:hypothetical protein